MGETKFLNCRKIVFNVNQIFFHSLAGKNEFK
jgi:hypothetical protein